MKKRVIYPVMDGRCLEVEHDDDRIGVTEGEAFQPLTNGFWLTPAQAEALRYEIGEWLEGR